MTDTTQAVFIRIEGVLTARGVRAAAAYFAANAAGLRERALRLGHLAWTAPVYEVLGQSDRVLANRLAYLALRKAKVPAELHIYGTGGHGFGMRPSDTQAPGDWPGRLELWLKARILIGGGTKAGLRY